MSKTTVESPAKRRAGDGARNRPLHLVAGATLLALGTLYGYAALDIAFVQRFGPTFATVSESRGWGVHTGDTLAVAAALLAAGALVAAAVVFQRGLARSPSPGLGPGRAAGRS